MRDMKMRSICVWWAIPWPSKSRLI